MRHFRSIIITGERISRWISAPLFALLIAPATLTAHHGNDYGTVGTGAIDPFSGKSIAPASYLMYVLDGARGAKYNRDIYTSSLVAETGFAEGLFSLNLTLPYVYYSQKERPDAGRIGKVYFGGKLAPFRSALTPFFLVFDSRIGFPTSSDTDHFTPEDFWDGSLGVTMGVQLGRFTGGLRIGGQQPLSRFQPRKDVAQENVPGYLRGVPDPAKAPDQIQLKKVTEGSLFLGVQLHKRLSIYTGYYHRTPFNGIVWEKPRTPRNYLVEPFDPLIYYVEKKYDTRAPLPDSYGEASVGISANYSRYTASLSYRHPLERERNIRPFESVTTLAVSMKFGGFEYEQIEEKE